MIKRRQGEWDEAIRHMEQAITVDPRDPSMISETAATYHITRRYGEAARLTESALAWDPVNFGLHQLRASIDMDWKSDLGRWKALIASETGKAASAGDLANTRFELAMLERDYHTASQILADGKIVEFDNNGFFVPKEWNQAIIARGLGDEAGAKTQLLVARERAAARVDAQPENAQALIVLAQIDAALGRKEEAIREGERASELRPITKDAITGTLIGNRLAGIYAEVGETDRAFESLEKLTQIPVGVTYGTLKLRQTWDPLRRDPRFEELVQSLAPKDAR